MTRSVSTNLINEFIAVSTRKYDIDESLLDSYTSRQSGSDDNCTPTVSELEKKIDENSTLPNMWSTNYVGLYSQYAAVGLLYGANGVYVPFCTYVYDGPSNVCANSVNIILFAWNFKIIFAIITDCYRPFGLRRRPWMLFGWTVVLILLAILTFTAHALSVETWLEMMLLVQVFLMFSDVPADGYSVELGQLEPPETRGTILATGQRIRFSCCVLSGLLQTCLLNGPTTNAPGCNISAFECWSWGLTINHYYGLLFVLISLCYIPIWFLKEPEPTGPYHTISSFIAELWDTMQSLTTLNLTVFVVGLGCFSNFYNHVNIFLQYYVIKLTNLEVQSII